MRRLAGSEVEKERQAVAAKGERTSKNFSSTMRGHKNRLHSDLVHQRRGMLSF